MFQSVISVDIIEQSIIERDSSFSHFLHYITERGQSENRVVPKTALFTELKLTDFCVGQTVTAPLIL